MASTRATPLTPPLRDMLVRVELAADNGGVLSALSLLAAGGREPAKLKALIAAGLVEVSHDPTVRITTAGRVALRKKGRAGLVR